MRRAIHFLEDAHQINKAVREAAQAMRDADALLITAGAGMGVDSGLPDFRGPEGFWKAYPALATRGVRFEEMANPASFAHAPELAWAFYGHRLNLYRATTPHAGFARLLEIAEGKPGGCFVFTSNVDGHFQKAGFPSNAIVECHGSINHMQCCSDCRGQIWDASTRTVIVDPEKFQALPPLPSCPGCDGLARPNILMFADGSWNPARTAEQETALQEWIKGLKERKTRLAIVELGAGSAIPTVRNFSERTARQLRATLIRINPGEPEIRADGIALRLGAAHAIERIYGALQA